MRFAATNKLFIAPHVFLQYCYRQTSHYRVSMQRIEVVLQINMCLDYMMCTMREGAMCAFIPYCQFRKT